MNIRTRDSQEFFGRLLHVTVNTSKSGITERVDSILSPVKLYWGAWKWKTSMSVVSDERAVRVQT
jgi:hypothetical protein